MNNNQLNDEMLNMASKKLGVSPEQLKNSASQGEINNIMKNLPKSQADKVQEVLSDKDQLEKLLQSEKAQKLLKMFMGGKG